ncbi:MAG TPA: DUF222 domain-containing protein, partial [Lacisediminihabitans sp.]|uniref:HNH endonuclease n=1 Tax=Lacisediminihabitans sp. TaxID=2787631 RepID=UPI002EDB2217
MNQMAASIEQATSLLGQLAGLDLAALGDEDLCALVGGIERAGRFVDALRALSAAQIEERSRFELGSAGLSYRLGERRGAHLVERLTRASQAEAERRIRLGAAIQVRRTLAGQRLDPVYPVLAAGVADGGVGVDAAAQIVRCLDQAKQRCADTELMDEAERALVTAATHESADLVATRARVWREALDPDGARPREEELRQRRGFRLGRERNGLTPFSGAADPVSAALLRAAFAESTAPDVKPRFLGAEDLAAGTESVVTETGEVVTTVRDVRSREQRQFDVFLGLVTAGIRSPGVRPTTTVMATIRLQDLESGTGVGWLDDVIEPVSGLTVKELACDAGLRPVLLGNSGEVLYEGHLERFFTPAQRRALAVRDGGCVWGSCGAPPGWCHAHHVIEAERGGPTDIDNGVLLCPAHHHLLHASGFTMTMVDGRPWLLAPPELDPDQTWRRLGKARVT